MTQAGPEHDAAAAPGSAHVLLIPALSMALWVCLLDALTALASAPAEEVWRWSVLPPAAVLLALVLPAGLVLGLLAGVRTAARAPHDRVARAMALAFFVVAAFVGLQPQSVSSMGALREAPVAAGLRIFVLCAIAACGAIGVGRLIRSRAGNPSAERRVVVAVGLVSFAAATLGLAACLLPALSPSTALVSALHWSVVATCLAAVCWWIRRRRSLVGLQVALWIVCLGILSGALPAYRTYIAREPELSSSVRDGHAVPRILLITIDTLRRDSLGCYGGPGTDTPSLDALARDSVVFRNAFTPSPWTIPSFVSFMTGVSADVHGVNENFAVIPGSYKTLAEHMGDAGYLTAAVGRQPQLVNMGRGFQDHDFLPRRLPFHLRMTATRVLYRLLDDERPTEEVTDAASDWLERNQEQEFFLWVHYLDPHTPYEPPARFAEGDELIEKLGLRHPDTVHPGVRSGSVLREAEEHAWLRRLYDAEVRFVDSDIGRLLDRVRKLGIYEDTLIVVTNDHGEEFWEHGNWEHGQSLYDELVRAALIVKLPGAARAGSVEDLVSTDALLPTLLDVCGVPHERGWMTAHSFAGSLMGESEPEEARPVFLGGVEYYEERLGVAFDRYKYVRVPHSGYEELFDLVADPLEQHSIAETNPEALARGRALLDERVGLRDLHGELRESSGQAADVPMGEEIERALRELGYGH